MADAPHGRETSILSEGASAYCMLLSDVYSTVTAHSGERRRLVPFEVGIKPRHFGVPLVPYTFGPVNRWGGRSLQDDSHVRRFSERLHNVVPNERGPDLPVTARRYATRRLNRTVLSC